MSLNKFVIVIVFLGFYGLLFLVSVSLAQHRQPVTKKTGPESKPANPFDGKRSAYDVPSDLTFGEASVTVKSSSLTHKVAIATNGVIIVEFPADDAVYSVHPGNQALVELDGMNSRENDRRPLPTDPLVFRPGAEFPSTTKNGKNAATLYTIQFVSGLVVTLKFYPVSDLDLNTNRLVLSYSVSDIQQARTTAGLSANMVKRPQPKVLDNTPARPVPVEPKSSVLPPTGVTAQADSPQVGGSPGENPKARSIPAEVVSAPTPVPVSMTTQPGVSQAEVRGPEVQPMPPLPTSTGPQIGGPELNSPVLPSGDAPKPLPDGLRVRLESVLTDFKKEDPRTFHFSPSTQGLSVAFTQTIHIGTFSETIYTVAIRNDSGDDLVMVPDQPDVFVVTKAKGTVVNTERFEIRARLTTLQGNRLAKGEVAYFVIAVERPILGVNQDLEISFAQADAADVPASLNVIKRQK